MEFSKEQLSAINAKNRELLVSAAAGSGKTAVLIEKIYTMLKEDGLSVDRMLVVTYTNAAAAEMRERLKRRMAGDPSPELRRQRERLELAQISTLHSFCHKLVSEYFQAADVDPLSAIADTAASSNLFQEALDAAMDTLYTRAAEGDAAAAALTAKFEDNRIVKVSTELYTFLMTLAEPFAWLQKQAEKTYTLSDLETGAMADTLMADCLVLLDGARELADELRALTERPACHEKYIPAIRGDIRAADQLTETVSRGLLAVVQAAQAFHVVDMPRLRNLSDEEKEVNLKYKDLRAGLKDLAGKVGGLLTQSPEAAVARLNAMQPALWGLHGLCVSLHAEYLRRKKQRSLLDYNDLEHMALEILSHPEIRAAVAARYDAVFVDEYQDISGVQEALLNAVKDIGADTKQRFFYVGDVKQSIYRFRQADPTLFMEKERTFADAEGAPLRRIDLNRNYRSRGAVIAAVNRVFERVMRSDVTEIAYDSRARLYPGLETDGDTPVRLHIFTPPMTSADKTRVQAAAIGREIKKRVGQPYFDSKENKMRALRFRDVAILAPRMKGVDEVVTRALGALNIPVYAEGSGEGLQSDEITQVLCHLRLMDNVQDDLSLLACLRSPAIGMTDQELADIRIRCPRESFLEAVRKAAAGVDALAGRCANALREIGHERFLMRNTPLPEYLWGFLTRSGLYAFYGCQPYGKLRQANLRLLCEKAVEFQSRGAGGLHAFLQSVVSVTAARESVSPTVLGPREDVVRVMTIHKSKGLEFPVVFLMGLETPMGRRGGSELSLHPKLGVALPYIDEVRRVKGDTLLSSAIGLRLQSEELAENARKLYVGMTRARDELVMTGCMEVPRFSASAPSAYAVANARHMLEWLTLCTDPRTDSLTLAEGGFTEHSTSFPHKTGVFCVVSHNSADESVDLMRILQPQSGRQTLEFQRQRLAQLAEEARLLAPSSPAAGDAADPLLPSLPRSRRPFKVGVTALARSMKARQAETPFLVDPENDDPGEAETSRQKRLPLPLTRPRQIADLPALPAFLRGAAGEQPGVLRGIAAHKALCLLRYAPLRDCSNTQELRHSIEEQLRRFLKRRLFTGEEFRLLDAGTLAAFFESAWGRDALQAETVKREWGFVLALPEEDGMLVQGVIDLCYLKDGQWALLDYKTDRVETADALWPLYEAQIALYRRALEEITEVPVRSVTLYSLSLNEGTSR
ncbi:MAG: UvrD-helicase domain-containing protein [Clostridiales bacterium]|nr:UvrD-helicase domain-containing protein [Clostridiales bacterium]